MTTPPQDQSEHVSNWVDKTYSKLTGTRAPLTADNERKLDRSTRRALAQLRCGHSPYLNSFLLVEPTKMLMNVSCVETRVTQPLIFSVARQVQLQVEDLWTKPLEVAIFLGLVDRNGNNIKDQQEQDGVLYTSSPKRSKTEGVFACSHESKNSVSVPNTEGQMGPGCQGDSPHPDAAGRACGPGGSPTSVGGADQRPGRDL